MQIYSKNFNINNYNHIFNKNVHKRKIAFGNKVSMPAHKFSIPNKCLKGSILGLLTLTAATCSNIRGGNFVYNDETERIERFDETHKLDIVDTEFCSTNKYNLKNCFDKDYLKSIDIDKWVENNKEVLVGSCLFDTNSSPMSKIIRIFTNQSDCEYVPTHAASIYEDDNGQIKVMQIKPPKVVVEDLASYLKNTKNDYVIYLRDFNIDKKTFSESVKKDEGRIYGYLSAAQSVSDLINFDFGLHCSESYIQQLQKQGMFKNVDANNITPHTLFHMLINMKDKHSSTIS